MQVESRVKQGVAAYICLNLNERDKENFRRIYDTVLSTRETLGHTLYTYDQFKGPNRKFERI